MMAAYLYHVTYVRNLGGIAQYGLIPWRRTRALGAGAGYDDWSRHKVFFSEPDGVIFWYGSAEYWAFNEHDDPLAEGYTPVVLRIPEHQLKDRLPDELGTEAACAGAWYVARVVPPTAHLQVWTGKRWRAVARTARGEIDAASAYDLDGVLLPDRTNPLYPRL